MQTARLFLIIATIFGLPLIFGCSGAVSPPGEGNSATDSDEPGGWVPPAASEFSAAPAGKPDFIDVTATSGVKFIHTDGGGKERYVTKTVVSGLALFDYDNDGLIDIYFVNGAPNPGVQFDSPPRNALYRNLGDFKFEDVTDQAGVGDTGYGLGATVGDYDNDGDADIYVSNFGPNVLYQNNGDETFTDVTAKAGVQSDRFGAGVSFLDIEGDGDLDLFVGCYVKFTYEDYVPRMIGEHEFAEVPRAFEAETDMLFRNDGDGTFTDISKQSGIDSYQCRDMGVICFDYDSDNDTDIFIANDNGPNHLLKNDGAGRFEEVGLLAGVAHDLSGGDNGSMGVACGDYDNDGLLDLYVTNYQAELSVLYHNLGDGLFGDVSRTTRADPAFPHVKWGCSLADFDHDGDRDLFIACGHFMENIRFIDDRTGLKPPNYYAENRDGVFHDVSTASGAGMSVLGSSKGAAFGDLDNDGDLDAVIVNVNDTPTLLRNDLKTDRRSIQIKLRGTTSSRDGVGAKVKVITGDKTQLAEAHGGEGYQSYYGSRLHFGLGDSPKPDRIEVAWPGGETEVYEDLPETRFILLEQGSAARAFDPASS